MNPAPPNAAASTPCASNSKKDSGKPNVALADWVAPGKLNDYIGGFVVGIHGADEFAAELDVAHDPYGAIMVKALADRFAEAFAELLHHRARVEWGYETAQRTHHRPTDS